MKSTSTMEVITVSVGQGDLAIVRSQSEAFVVDCRIPARGDSTTAYVKGYLSTFLKDRNVRGLMITGFDKDHADARGVAIVMHKYQPDWVMYPDYRKDTAEYKAVMTIITDEKKRRESTNHPLEVLAISLENLGSRHLNNLLSDFNLQIFSPHPDDMNSSNNCGIVCRVEGTMSDGFSYLITGDTEQERWDVINRYFGRHMDSDVVSVPHHGSKNGTTAETIANTMPECALISAGVGNQFGHPDDAVVKAWRHAGADVRCTCDHDGQSLVTRRKGAGFVTIEFEFE